MSRKKQIPVDMSLPQSRGKPMARLFELFRRKVFKKSAERADEVVNPTQLILAFSGLKIDTQMGVVVVKGSFEPILHADKEIGFRARVESALFTEHWLYVYKKGKAYLERV